MNGICLEFCGCGDYRGKDVGSYLSSIFICFSLFILAEFLLGVTGWNTDGEILLATRVIGLLGRYSF